MHAVCAKSLICRVQSLVHYMCICTTHKSQYGISMNKTSSSDGLMYFKNVK